jgi:hypothetical protein
MDEPGSLIMPRQRTPHVGVQVVVVVVRGDYVSELHAEIVHGPADLPEG